MRMKSVRLFKALFCAALCLSGCGKEMTVVRAYPQTGSESIVSENARWKTSYNSGLAHFNKREYTEALELFAVALKYTGEDDETRAWIYFSMGRCWEGLKDLPKAEQNYIMAQNLDPNLSEASDGLARITKLRAQQE